MRSSFQRVLTVMTLASLPAAHAANPVTFEEYAPGTEVVFQEPAFSGSTSANVATGGTSGVSSEQAFSGTNSYKVDFAFVDNTPTRWVRLTTFATPTLPNPTIDFTQSLSMRVFVASQDPISFALGVRETNSAADIFENGGTTGGIETLGLAGKLIAPGSWQNLVFDIPNENVNAFAGATANGILESTTGKGVLEHLRIASPGTGNQVTFYIDDLRVGPVQSDVIPEPGSMALLASGLLPLLALRRRR